MRLVEKGSCRSHWSVQTLPFCLRLLHFFWQITWHKPPEEGGLYSFSLFRGWHGRVCGEGFIKWRGTGSKAWPSLLKGLLLMAWICQLGPMSKGSITSPNCNLSWRPSVQTCELLGTYHIQTMIPLVETILPLIKKTGLSLTAGQSEVRDKGTVVLCVGYWFYVAPQICSFSILGICCIFKFWGNSKFLPDFLDEPGPGQPGYTCKTSGDLARAADGLKTIVLPQAIAFRRHRRYSRERGGGRGTDFYKEVSRSQRWF